MPVTKANSKRNPIKSKRGTLDQQHMDKLNTLDKKSNSIPKKKLRLKKLEEELEHLTSVNPNKYTHNDIHRKAHLLDAIEKLKNDIHKIENCTESLNYIVDVLPILIDYYDNEEIIDDGMEEEIMNLNSGGKKNILTYFAREMDMPEIKKKSPPPPRPKRKTPNKNKKKSSGSKSMKLLPEPEPKPKCSRAKLYENYLCIVNSTTKGNIPKNNKCTDPACPGEKIICQNDGYITCNTCGMSELSFMITEKPNYKEPTQDTGVYAYKRINHLTEIISQLQAKESTDIPPKVFESILREIKKRKIDKYDLDIFKLRRILKKLNYRKYYEHVPHILQIINGKEPPNFSRMHEMKIKKMFKEIQKPFAIFCPKNRKNFLNYSYVLHKFCELLDLDEYIGYFPLLKNNAKLLQHDKIWRNICGYMRWFFYRSL